MSGLVLALNLRMRYVDSDGLPIPGAGYIGLLNPVTFQIENPEANRQARISKRRDDFGSALDEIVTPQPSTISISTDETGDAEVLAWALSGRATSYSQAAATVSDQAVVVAKGEWERLPHRAISDVVIEPAGGGTPYEENVDYFVDYRSGMIRPTPGGAIQNGPVSVSYEAEARSGKRIGSGTRPTIQVRIEGDGINKATGKAVNVLVRRINLSASGALDLVGDDFLVTEMTGTPIKIGNTDPVEVEMDD